MYTHRLVDLTVSLVRETDKAWLVSDGERNTWLAKSACELEPLAGGKHYTLTLNEAYAIEKGLV